MLLIYYVTYMHESAFIVFALYIRINILSYNPNISEPILGAAIAAMEIRNLKSRSLNDNAQVLEPTNHIVVCSNLQWLGRNRWAMECDRTQTAPSVWGRDILSLLKRVAYLTALECRTVSSAWEHLALIKDKDDALARTRRVPYKRKCRLLSHCHS